MLNRSARMERLLSHLTIAMNLFCRRFELFYVNPLSAIGAHSVDAHFHTKTNNKNGRKILVLTPKTEIPIEDSRQIVKLCQISIADHRHFVLSRLAALNASLTK